MADSVAGPGRDGQPGGVAGEARSTGLGPVAPRLIVSLARLPLTALAATGGLALWWLLRWFEAGDGDGGVPGSVVAAGLTIALVVGAQLVRSLAAGLLVAAGELERVANRPARDPLTGLLDRTGITADIDRRLGARRPGDIVAVLFCDLDRLRVVNDSLGHAAGDEVVSVAARRLGGVVRGGDAIGRFGGDGFVVVSSGLPALRDLEILADRVVDALGRPTVLADGSAQVVSGTVGLAWVAGDDRERSESAVDLLRDAALAMNRAKKEGGARHALFDESHRAEAVARLELEQELRAGITAGEIAVHYQPIVETATGRVDRVEALIRWNHPSRGTILPSRFLPVAAESRLMLDLGRIVLTEACHQAAVWSENCGRPITVAVNVAERQLIDLGLIDTVTRALAETGLPPAQLELEVTEELVLDRLEESLVLLRQLDLLGVRLAIDDFGTSRASLSRLKRLAMVSTLKIDRSFVTELVDPSSDGPPEDTVDAKIVAAIVALAGSVGLSVVAEGVETPAQARVLDQLGVEHLQGFLFGRPAPATDVEPLLDLVHRSSW